MDSTCCKVMGTISMLAMTRIEKQNFSIIPSPQFCKARKVIHLVAISGSEPNYMVLNRMIASRWMLFEACWNCVGDYGYPSSLKEHPSVSYFNHAVLNQIIASKWMFYGPGICLTKLGYLICSS